MCGSDCRASSFLKRRRANAKNRLRGDYYERSFNPRLAFYRDENGDGDGESQRSSGRKDTLQCLSTQRLQRVPFIGVTPSEEKGYPTYKRVEGGMHQDGTFQFRGNFTKMGAIIQTADMSL